MNGLDVGRFGGGNDSWNLEVTFGGDGRADTNGSIGQLDVRSVLVGQTVDGHAFNAEIVASPDDSQGDFPAIGDEDALEHGHLYTSTLNSGWPYSTGWALSTR